MSRKQPRKKKPLRSRKSSSVKVAAAAVVVSASGPPPAERLPDVSASPQTATPFIGPRPFRLRDQKLFFGREREADQLASLVAANQFVVVFAQSGAGKTSLLQAGVTPQLHSEGFDVLVARVRPDSMRDQKQLSNPFVANALLSLSSLSRDDASSSDNPKEWWTRRSAQSLMTMSFGDFLSQRTKPCVVIFDQFEELFALHQAHWSARQEFFEQVRDATEGCPTLLGVEHLEDPARLVSELSADHDPVSHYVRHDVPGNLVDVFVRWQAHGPKFTSKLLRKVREDYLANPTREPIDRNEQLAREVLLTMVRQLNRAIECGSFRDQMSEQQISSSERLQALLDHCQGYDSARRNRRLLADWYHKAITPVTEGDPQVRIVFSIREDYVASLTPYLRLFSDRLRTRFRLERLRHAAALAAVEGPLVPTGKQFDKRVAEALVDDLMSAGDAAGGVNVEPIVSEFVEPVQLQIVCQNLWNRLPKEAHTITREDLAKSGSVSDALAAFYVSCIANVLSPSPPVTPPSPLLVDVAATKTNVTEGEIRRWCESKLITAAGTRAVVFRGDQTTEGLPNLIVEKLDEMHLIKEELRGVRRWYELSHDRLVAAVRQSNRAWFQERAAKEPYRLELEDQATKWHNSANAGQKVMLLLTKPQLQRARVWMQGPQAREVPLSETVQSLIQASHESHQRQNWFTAFLVIVVLAMLVSGAFWLQTRRSEQAVMTLRGSMAADLARQPGREFDALVLGIQAVKSDVVGLGEPPQEAVTGLREAVTAVGPCIWLRGFPEVIRHSEFSPDGQLVLVVCGDELSLWRAESGEFIRRIEPPKLSDRADLLRGDDNPAQVGLEFTKSGSLPNTNAKVAPSSRWSWATFGFHGRWIIARTESASKSSRASQSSPMNSPADGPRQPERFVFWDAFKDRQLEPHLEDGVKKEQLAGITADGSRVVVSDSEHHIRLLDADPQSSLSPIALSAPLPDLQRVDLSPDGLRAVTFSRYATTLWDTESGQPIQTLELVPAEQATFNTLRFSNDGSRFVLWWDENAANDWLLPGLVTNKIAVDDKEPHSPTDSEPPAPPSVWDARTGLRMSTFQEFVGGGLSFQDDGRTILSLTGYSAQIWTSEDGRLRTARRAPMPRRHRSFDSWGRSTARHFSNGLVTLLGDSDVSNAVVLWDAIADETLFYIEALPGVLGTDQIQVIRLPTEARFRLLIHLQNVVRIWDANALKFEPAQQTLRQLRELALNQLRNQPECNQIPWRVDCGKSHPARLAGPVNTSQAISSPILRASLPASPSETEAERAAREAILATARSAGEFFSSKLSVVPPLDLDVVLLDETARVAYWSGVDHAVFASPEVRFLPDVTAWQVAHAYITHVSRLGSGVSDESRALETSFAQILALLVKQSRPNRNPDEDWLLAPGSGAWFAGKDIERTVPKVPYVSFKTLGQAAGDVLMEQPGRQVAHMRDFVAGDDGIYVSSGIPNKVFYDVSNAISVEHSSEIWFAALRKLPKDAKFLDAAEITIALAGQRFGMNSREQQSLRTAWKSVGVLQDDATESGTRNP